MPAIKLKKATQEYLAEKEREKEAKAAASQAASTPKPTKKDEPAVPKPQPVKPKTKFLEAEVLYEKRKRTIPVAEQRVITWIEDNLEVKEGYCLPLARLYECYTESCIDETGHVVENPVFNKHVKELFPKGFGFKELSPMKGVLKEKKQEDRKAKPKVVAESLNLKFKDIIDEVMNEIGNPKKGRNFNALKRKISSKYPALMFESHPQKLLGCLERGLRFGYVELVKGTGKCGFYRIPGESTAEEDIVKKKPKETKEGEEEEVPMEEDGEKSEEKKPSAKKNKKRKRKDTEESEAKEGESEAKEEGEPDKKKEKKVKKKKKTRRQPAPFAGSASLHGDPQKIGDVFPLAMTYMSDPKEASYGKIKKYISLYYPDVCLETKLKKAMEKGVEKGLWEQVTGASTIQGSYRLLALDFNPNSSETIEDMICQALVASHEPKACSAGLIKKYLLEYHSNFSIDSKPYLFKKALEKACKINKIKQLSGIGASGSFQLVESFVPSPAILAGDVDGEMEDKVNAANLQLDEDFSDEYKEVYIVRKTKSGRTGRGKVPPITVVAKQKRR